MRLLKRELYEETDQHFIGSDIGNIKVKFLA